MRILAQRLATVIIVLAFAHVSSAQTADEIIEKSIAAMGGRAAMEKLKTRFMSGTIAIGTPAGDIAGTVEMYTAAPNKQRMVLKADLSQFGAGQLVVDQRFDGTTGYMMDSMQGNRDITGNQLDNMKAQTFPHTFLTYKAQGISVKLAPKEKVGDRDAFVLILEPAAGSPIKQYVDAESFLPTRAVISTDLPQVGKIEQTMDPSDFRTVDGTKIPFQLKISNAMQNISMTFTKIENNVPVDEKMFVKP
jgi:outer membrane lipoprotein-sorting protein